MKSKKSIIGSRGSKLALIYAERAKSEIMKFSQISGIEDVEIKSITTKGDTIQNVRLSELGGKGLFSKTIEDELLDEKIDNNKLAQIAFQDQDHQLRLNSIIHPYVFQEIDENFDDILEKGTNDIFVVDAALIYESGADTHMDYVIVITALLKIRMERALQRETLTRDEILKRID